ncbi:MAG: hypothetical protein HY749_18895 [Gammaproteobacteria bacterium]|nr:hypothetical protein [Gammaproteobacteria bacterium]
MQEQLVATIAQASPAHFWIATLIGSAVIAWCCYAAFANFKRKRLIEDLPTSLLRSAAQGYVELKGRAELIDGERISGPLTGFPCTWFRYRVEERQQRTSRGRSEASWRTVDEGTSASLFYLVDPTGRCAVDPDGAIVTPSHKVSWYGRHRQPDRPPNGGALRVWFQQLGCSYRYTEERIAVSSPLYALGTFTTHGGVDGGMETNAEVGVLLREWKKDQTELLRRFDRNRDGCIDADEWQAVRAAAAEEVLRARTDTAPLAVDLLHKSDNLDRPYVLSAVPEEDLLRRLTGAAFAQLLFGVVGLTGLFWVLSQRLAA